MRRMRRKKSPEKEESATNLMDAGSTGFVNNFPHTVIKMETSQTQAAQPQQDAVDVLLVNYRQRLKELHPNTYFYRQRRESACRRGKVTTPVITNTVRVPAKKHASLDTTQRIKKGQPQRSPQGLLMGGPLYGISNESLQDDGVVSSQSEDEDDGEPLLKSPGRKEDDISEEQIKFVSNEEWLRALEYAITTGNHQLLRQYIQGYDFKKEKPYTLLHLAVNESQKECARVLLQSGADINAQDERKRTPLFYALFNKNKEMFEFIISSKANPNVQDIETMTVALYASAFCLASFLEVIVDKADLGLCNEAGRCVLHYAAVQREPRCLELVLPHRAEYDIDAQDSRQETPLHLAALAKREKNVRLLLNYGADPTMLSKDSLTPAHYSSFLWDTISLKEFIQTGDIDINLGDAKGRTLLHHAVMENPANRASNRSQADCVQYLTQLKGIELNKTDKQRETALGYAVRHDSNLARLLISAGANVNGMKKLQRQRDPVSVDYVPPLHRAAKSNQLDSTLLLLGEKALIDTVDENKMTALHIATEEENIRIVEVLLQNNADASIRNGEEKNPLEIAVEKLNHALVNLIVQHAAYPVDNNGVYEINLGVLLPKDKRKPETELLNRINEAFKDHYKKSIFLLPAVRAFLNLKVKCLSKLEIAWVIMTVLFLGFGFNFLFQDANCLFKHTNSDTNETASTDSIPEICYSWDSTVMLSWLLWVLMLPTYLISEVMEFRSSVGSYVTNLENYLDVFLILSCIVLCPWSFFSVATHKVIVIVAMITCGLDFMLALGAMTSVWKVQMMMFRGVLKRAFLLLIPFIPLLLCFSFAIHVVLQRKEAHQTAFFSFMESLGYMVGNIENLIDANDPIEKKIALAFLFVSFVFLIIVVMMNLLTGLAVNITEQFRTDALYRATQRRIITTYQKETMVHAFNFLNFKKCSLKNRLKNKENESRTVIRFTSSKTKMFSKLKELWKKLRLNLGHVKEEKKWPMRWIGISKRDIISIERTRRKAQKSRVVSNALETFEYEDDVDGSSVYSDAMTGDDMEVIEMQLGQLFEKMLQLEALLVNKPAK